MNAVGRAIWVELLKARRSKMPLFTAVGFSLLPLAGGFFMIIMKDPELARRVGLISAKAQISMGSADWPTYLNFLAQGAAVGGSILFSLMVSWIFGREYSDRTIKDLLALPTSRTALVLAKFCIVAAWSASLIALIYLEGLVIGLAVALPAASSEMILQGTITLAVAACLTVALVTPTAFLASAGHGYLLPMGVTFLTLALAQIIAVAGWGEFFPYSVPAIYANAAGDAAAQIGLLSYWLVLLTSLAGAVGTILWWELADQNH